MLNLVKLTVEEADLKDVNDTIDDSTSAGPHSLESLATEIELLKKKVAALEESSPSR